MEIICENCQTKLDYQFELKVKMLKRMNLSTSDILNSLDCPDVRIKLEYCGECSKEFQNFNGVLEKIKTVTYA